MSSQQIRQSIEALASRFAANPQDAMCQDKPAVATLELGLRCKAVGPKGETLVTDMPGGVGGGNSAPTPGWFLRAALANCDATVIAMRAAQLGIELTTLEVTVGSQSDNRGLVSDTDSVPAGPLSVHVRIRIGAEGVSAQVLHDIVRWAERHSPVADALRRAVPVTAEIVAG